MGERKQETEASESYDDLYEPSLGEFAGDDLDDEAIFDTGVSEQARLAAKRRAAERRLEALRLREELGDYDFDFDDDY